jgi:hypothetical protein
LKRLREIPVFLLAVSLGLLPNVLAQGQKASPPSKPRSKAAPPRIREVSLDEVLGWRKPYEDLLGEDIAVTKERFGLPDRVEGSDIVYSESAKTGNRLVRFFVSASPYNKIVLVTVYPRDDEFLDFTNIFVRAPLFCFRTGTWTDTTHYFFEAQSRDGRNILQFAIVSDGLLLDRVIFLAGAAAKACDPGRVAPASE